MRMNRNDPYDVVVQYPGQLVLATDHWLLSDSHRILETQPVAGQSLSVYQGTPTQLYDAYQDQYGAQDQTTREREREREKRERDGNTYCSILKLDVYVCTLLLLSLSFHHQLKCQHHSVKTQTPLVQRPG